MKAYGGVDLWIHVFLSSALVGGEWSASRPGCITRGERAPGTHWIGGWVDPRTGLDDVERRKFLPLPRLELRSLCPPARSQSLYRLRYPGSLLVANVPIKGFDFENNPNIIPLRHAVLIFLLSSLSTTSSWRCWEFWRQNPSDEKKGNVNCRNSGLCI
jgi:hypothetical protein